MEQELQRPEIFNTWDHVTVLNDFFKYQKSLNPSFSVEMLARKTKVLKRPLLSLIFSGKRRLSEDKIFPLCRALGMNKEENQYVHSLVRFNFCKDPRETSKLLTEVLMRRPTRPTLEGDRKILLTKWYYIPLLELIKIPGFKNDPKWIATRFRKKILVSEVVEAMEVFSSLGLVTNTDDKWIVNEKMLRSPYDLPSKAIQAYHDQNLEVSKTALIDLPVNQREFLGVTFPVTNAELQEIKEELRKVCEKIVMNRPEETQFEEVASLNIQFYLLTKNDGE
jgi:uncharacterized protein (TIGR02147 family)